MRIKFVVLAIMASIAAPVSAQVAGDAQVSCVDEVAVLSVSATAAAQDVGRPGAWFIAAHDPFDGLKVAFLTPAGWKVPDVPGTLIPYGAYLAGIPPSISTSACVPGSTYDEGGYSGPNFSTCGAMTDPWAGYILKVGYGVLTVEGEALVATRRARLDAVKPIMVQEGRWRADHEDDDRMRESLVMKSLRENGRTADVMSLPSLQCFYSG